ncbi:MAG: serpin family protein [Prevotella sp.]|nr:serpin family protein [Prevotella sp.]
MKKKTLWAATALMVATVWTGCSNDNNVDEVQLPKQETPTDDFTPEDSCDVPDFVLTRAEQQLVAGSNDFAFNLFRRAREESKSLILSPISITYALGMLNNGAVGETQQQINNVLGFGTEGALGINNFCRKMLYCSPRLDSLTKVLISNTIFINQNRGYTLYPDFVKKAAYYYEATPEARDFNDGKTLDVINQWASDHTEGMIEKILNEEEFDPRTVSYLMNAVYFKGEWKHKFDKEATFDLAFEGSNKKVPTMWMTETLGYADNEDCQVLCMPYGNGAYRMTILLPHKGKSIGDVLKGLTAESWQNCQNLTETLVNVMLPRFESNTSLRLERIMSDLGMPLAFDEDAEITKMVNRQLYIKLMKQVARIKVDEEGSEAAAVTIINAKDGAGYQEPSYVEFHATRPFLYFISEQSTGAIFFMGQYMGD